MKKVLLRNQIGGRVIVNNGNGTEDNPDLGILNFLFPKELHTFVLIDGQNISPLTGKRKRPLDLSIFTKLYRLADVNGNTQTIIKYFDWHHVLDPSNGREGWKEEVELVKIFFADLESQGAIILGNNLKEVRKREESERTHGNCKSTNMDYWIIQELQACLMNPFCSTIIMVSGDGDFAELLGKAKNLGKTVISVSPQYAGSSLLVEASTESVELRGLLGIGPPQISRE